ncbi:3'-5' exonuclease family protein, partial [Staphylococcus epidermidis]
KLIHNQITHSFHTLLNPFHYFTQTNITLHPIHPRHVQHPPAFKHLYPYILKFIHQLPLLAHNPPFHINLLHQTLKAH